MPSRISYRISKRSKAVAPTVAELRNVLSRHDDDSKIDEIGEVDVLRQVFNVLRKKFHPTTTQSNRDALRIRKLDVAALQIPDAVVAALPGWLENLWTFWGSWTLHNPAFDSSRGSYGGVRQFVEASWAIRGRLSESMVLWRFSSVALCLAFKQWNPDWLLSSYLIPEYVTAFLSTFGCSDTNADVKKTIHIIRSGQRRLSFCEELSRSETQERDPHQDEVVYSKLETLGILFLDDIPDSSFDGERAMSYSDVRVTTKFLRSHHITKWLKTSGAGQNAIRLLDFPVHDTFLELSNSRCAAGTTTDRLEGIIAASRVTRQEPEVTTVSIASRQRGHLAISTNAPYTRQEHGTTPEVTTNKLVLHAGSLPAATDAVTHGRMQRGIVAVTPDGTVECPLAPLSLGAGGSPESIRRAQCAPLLEFSALSDGFGSDWQWELEAIGPYVQDVRKDRYCGGTDDGLGIGISESYAGYCWPDNT
ncbi:hypothetical protein G3M48_006383 [Beauveria asiatica]|uniref:Uncharacterized protein n=1 Tax=Beauveria asiatica TaxID=1069075 RepID=A0AAW0RQA1_9HYPO